MASWAAKCAGEVGDQNLGEKWLTERVRFVAEANDRGPRQGRGVTAGKHTDGLESSGRSRERM